VQSRRVFSELQRISRVPRVFGVETKLAAEVGSVQLAAKDFMILEA